LSLGSTTACVRGLAFSVSVRAALPKKSTRLLVLVVPVPEPSDKAAVDGGKIVMYAMEKISGRFVKLHYPLAIAGWVFMLAVMIYATILDVGKLTGGKLL